VANEKNQVSRYTYETRPDGPGRHTWSLFEDGRLVREGTVEGDPMRAEQAAHAAAASVARGPTQHGGSKKGRVIGRRRAAALSDMPTHADEA